MDWIQRYIKPYLFFYILHLTLNLTLILKNNIRNAFYAPYSPKVEVLHDILTQEAKKINYQNGDRNSFWIFANKKNCPRLPLGQPS